MSFPPMRCISAKEVGTFQEEPRPRFCPEAEQIAGPVKVVWADACMIEHSSFSPEHEKAITVAFEDCLRALGLTDRPSDPAVLVIARRIIELAKQGECNPALLRDGALKSVTT